MNNKVYNIDNMEFMKDIPDNYYELAIVDPPYADGDNFNFRFDKLYENKKPKRSYFNELFRISKNQIVWGGNYFTDFLPVSRFWISWFKHNPVKNFSDFELAWGSFEKVNKAIDLPSYGCNHSDKYVIHPTQKPVKLYKECLKRYAKPNDKIFDSHVGSGSIRIACHELGFDFEGCELDKDYYEAQEKRYKEWLKQYNNEFYIGDDNNLFS